MAKENITVPNLYPECPACAHLQEELANVKQSLKSHGASKEDLFVSCQGIGESDRNHIAMKSVLTTKQGYFRLSMIPRICPGRQAEGAKRQDKPSYKPLIPDF